MADRSISLVHDYLLVMRGAERSFAAMCDLWPTAPVNALLYDAEVFGERLAGHEVHTSPLQRFGAKQRTFKALLPLMPAAVERLDVSGHDVVISSSSAFAHGVVPDATATHVCYCYTPFRYAWYERDIGVAQAPAPLRPFLRRTLDRVRSWDVAAAQRGTHYVAISRLSQARIAEHWGVEAPIVYPPVQLDRFAPGEREDWALVVCELVRHKKVDAALEACRLAGMPVKVVGGGADETRLRALHGDHATFLGRLDDAAVADLYSRARTLVMPNVEEFGITAVEAQAAGCPVVAVAAGGALETIIDGTTGVLVPVGDVDALAEALRVTPFERFGAAKAIANAARFSVTSFQDGIREQVARALGDTPTQPSMALAA